MATPILPSSVRAFRKVRVGGNIPPETDKALTELQDNIDKSFNSLINRPSLNALTYTNINVTSGSVLNFNHGLDRTLVGWHIVGKSGFGDVHDLQSTNTTPQLTLKLLSNFTGNISLVVF